MIVSHLRRWDACPDAPSTLLQPQPPRQYPPWLSRSQGGPSWLLCSLLGPKQPWGEKTVRASGGPALAPHCRAGSGPKAHLAGGAGAGGLDADVAQERAVPEPGVDEPPRGWLLARDAVIVVVLACLVVLPPRRLLRPQHPAQDVVGAEAAWGHPAQPGPNPGKDGDARTGPSAQASRNPTCPGAPPPWGGCAGTA